MAASMRFTFESKQTFRSPIKIGRLRITTVNRSFLSKYKHKLFKTDIEKKEQFQIHLFISSVSKPVLKGTENLFTKKGQENAVGSLEKSMTGTNSKKKEY